MSVKGFYKEDGSVEKYDYNSLDNIPNDLVRKTTEDLVNYYLKSETYSRTEVDSKLSAIPKFSIQPVDSLPTSNISTATVYLLKSGEESSNLYTEYIYVNGIWEYLGTQTVDLSGYALKTDVPTKLSQLINDARFITGITATMVKNALGYVPAKESSVTELTTKVDEHIGAVIPDYWKVAVDNLEATIEALQQDGADAFQFLWLSDIHGVHSKTKNIGAVLRYTMDKYNIPCVIASGDIMSQSSHGSVSSVWTEYDQLKAMLSPVDVDEFIAVKGNHDGAWGSPVSIDGTNVYYLYNIGTKQIYNALYRRQAKDRTRVFGEDGTYFYVDVHDMRIFMLNSHTDGDSSLDENGYAKYNSMKNSVYGKKQLQWLCDSLNTMRSGQKAIISAHVPLNGSLDGDIVVGIITAFNNKDTYTGSKTISANYWGTDSEYSNISISADFTNATGKVLAYFHGHNHKDYINTSYSFPCIAITTAGGDVRDTDAVERVVGTITETAMDIVTINDTGIYMTRLGAGSDRYILVDNTVVNTYSVTNKLTNCTTSSKVISVEEGKPFSTTVTVNSGCELKSVKVTMSGVDITSDVYVDGVITIPEVTGNVVITVYASKIDTGSANYTNLADPTNSEWKDGYRISSSGISEQSGKTVCNPISCKQGDVIRVKGVEFEAIIDRVCLINSNGNYFSIQYVSNLPTGDYGYEYVDGVHKFSILSPNANAFRCAFTTPTDPSSVIITVNQSITDGSGDGSGDVISGNLFDTSGTGYTAWNGSKMYTNWIPFSILYKDGAPPVYHFKGWATDNSPYKYHLATDGAGTNATDLVYTWQNSPALQALTQSDYNSSVRILQPQDTGSAYTHIQFEFREDIASNLIITANEKIV